MDTSTKEFLSLFQDSDDPLIWKRQIAGLRRAIIGLAQDVDVLKELLRERQVFDSLRYKALRTKRMVMGHSGAGAAPWRSYSYFPYFLSEEDYLRRQLSSTDQEVQEFKNEVEFVEQLS